MKTKRIIAILIDLLTVSFIVTSAFWIIKILFNVDNHAIFNNFGSVIFIILLLSKDSILKGESLGKKICKLELLSLDNKKPSNVIKMLRNLTIYIFPVELILLLISNKRLGDIIFKTKVVEKHSNLEQLDDNTRDIFEK